MAVSKIKSVHCWQGRTAHQTLSETIGYALNPGKTTYMDSAGNEKILAQVYECGKDAGEAANDWLFTKNLYAKLTGRNQGGSDVLAYHIIQSFDPSESINPELANKIGYEMAKELTGGEFSFVVGTHLDKEHYHNHIVINSTALEATYKYRDVKKSFERVLKSLNDEVCKRYNVSVLEEREDGEKREEKTKYIHWLNRNFDKRVPQENKDTWQNKLRQVIDIILGRPSDFNVLGEAEQQTIQEKIHEDGGGADDLRPKDFNEFIKRLKVCGYEVKGLENKYISVRTEGQKKFTRLNAKTLGDEYARNGIADFIEGYRSPVSTEAAEIRREEFALPELRRGEIITDAAEVGIEKPIAPGPRVNRIIDVKNNAKAQSSVGYERWAKLQNLKTLADTHSYMAINGLTFSDVKDMVSEKEAEIAVLENEKEAVQALTERQKEIGALQNYLIAYVKNRKVYEEYKKGGYSKTFKAEHAEALESYSQARKYFDEYKAAHGAAKLPTMQELKSEYAELKEKKSGHYEELKSRREELKLLQTLKTNAMELLGVDENGGKVLTEKEEKHERGELIKAQKERLAGEKNFKNRKRKQR